MAVISGKSGTVAQGNTVIANVTGWKLSHKPAIHAFATNNTAGWKNRVKGVEDWSGSIDALYDTTVNLALVAGNTYTLNLSVDGTDSWTGNAIVGEMSAEVDINDGAPIPISFPFEGNGALTPPS